jgi:hypothetical protein
VSLVTTPACPVCGKTSLVELTEEEQIALDSRRYIQEALPDWTPEERELLITGTHPACWASLMPKEDE